LKNYEKKYVVGFDPSGNWHEGKGTTGWCVFSAEDKQIIRIGELSAATFPTPEEYWNEHLKLIYDCCDRYGVDNIVIVIEDYLLYASKAKEQTNSRMETPQLIGLIKHHCWDRDIPYVTQPAAEVKKRWSNDILHYKKYIVKKGRGYALPTNQKVLSRHSIDSIRHAVHYATFKNKPEKRKTR